MKPLHSLICIIACLVSVSAFACTNSGGTNYCGPEPVSLLYLNQSGVHYVRPSSAATGMTCTPVSGVYVILDPSAPNFKEVYALLLSARATGASVELVMDGSKPTCTIGYVVL